MITYFDTSALIGFYVRDPVSRAARDARARSGRVVTSHLAFAETHAALARLLREGVLGATACDTARQRFETDWTTFDRVRVDARLLPEIRRALRVHALTGADAVHLASASLARRALLRSGDELAFACGDRRLAAAAASDGILLAWPAAKRAR
ncbi:MAG: type II toxin-antitoxin system VapC family toxin [Myxococcota bacterium]|nr:type II toxin-antitoxin system VapC family toxin [Myxococcota bacterium]